MTKPTVSYCITCMGRLHHLRLTLKINIRWAVEYAGPVEFVLLNYNDQSGLDTWVRNNLSAEIKSGLVNYFHTTSPPSYEPSHAKNVSHLLAKGNILCNLDADNFIGRGFTEFLAENVSAEQFVCADYDQGGTFGRIALTKENFKKLSGYDEALRGYGYDDSDMVNRAKLSGLRKCCYPQKYAIALGHSRQERGANMSDKNVDATLERNRTISERNLAQKNISPNHHPWGLESVKHNFRANIRVVE